MSNQAKGVVLFDGECGICDSGVQRLIKLDRHKRILFAPLQGETAAGIIERHDELDHDVNTMVYARDWETEDEVPFVRSDAIIEVCRDIGGIVKLAVLARIVPRSWRDGIYDWIARNRHRWSDPHAACDLQEQRKNQERVLP